MAGTGLRRRASKGRKPPGPALQTGSGASPRTAPNGTVRPNARARKPASPFRYFNSSPEIIRLVVMMYVRFPLSLRNEEAG